MTVLFDKNEHKFAQKLPSDKIRLSRNLEGL